MRRLSTASLAALGCLTIVTAACGGSAPSSQRATATAPATASPVATQAPPSPSPTASPTETPTPAPPTETPTPPGPTVPPTATPTVTPIFVQTVVPRAERTPTPVPTPAGVRSLTPIVRLRIPSISVDAVIEARGRDANGQLQVPEDPSHVAWYQEFIRPGLNGNVVLAGFQFLEDGSPAPFRRLIDTRAGDEITIDHADGVQLHYRVISSAHYQRSETPLSEVIYPSYQPSGTQWLTLFTDGGDANGERGTYFDMVLAERIFP